jgi:hemoglobin
MNKYTGSGKERRAQIVKAIEAETGIDEALIEQLVRGFYMRVREDALLGPIFDARITEWEPHLQRMCAFWSSVALMSGRYHGQPMRVHLPLPIDARYFDRWLALFEATARDVCQPKSAAFFIDRAHRIAQSLEFGIAAARGIILGKGDRLISGVDGSAEGTGCGAAPVAHALSADT